MVVALAAPAERDVKDPTSQEHRTPPERSCGCERCTLIIPPAIARPHDGLSMYFLQWRIFSFAFSAWVNEDGVFCSFHQFHCTNSKLLSIGPTSIESTANVERETQFYLLNYIFLNRNKAMGILQGNVGYDKTSSSWNSSWRRPCKFPCESIERRFS